MAVFQIELNPEYHCIRVIQITGLRGCFLYGFGRDFADGRSTSTKCDVVAGRHSFCSDVAGLIDHLQILMGAQSMDGTNFIVPDRRPWQATGSESMSVREAACRLAICAAIVLVTFGLLVGLAAFGVTVPVQEIGAGP